MKEVLPGEARSGEHDRKTAAAKQECDLGQNPSLSLV